MKNGISNNNADIINDLHDDISREPNRGGGRLPDEICALDHDKLHTKDDKINVNIYRYKFTQEFMDELYQFSKIHQYDDRKSFKAAWDIWVEENNEIVRSNIVRLSELNYEGDVLDKMFKSARYYFRKKNPQKPEPKERREYVSLQKDILDAMDDHITSNIGSDDYKPSDGFVDFCNKHTEILKEEVKYLVEKKITDSTFIRDKIKKTYKNRYFMIISNK
jgi:hypothetical protein